MSNWYRNITNLLETATVEEDWRHIDIQMPKFDPDDGVLVLGTEMVEASLISETEPLHEKEGIEELAEQILNNKMFVRIEVNDTYEILNGHHRFLAITKVLKWTHVPCVIIELGHYDALNESVDRNSDDYHYYVHKYISSMAAKFSSSKKNAAIYYRLSVDTDQSKMENHYEEAIVPYLEKFGYPSAPVGVNDDGDEKFYDMVNNIIEEW